MGFEMMDDEFLREKESIRKKMLEFSKGINEGKSVSELIEQANSDEAGVSELSASDKIIKERIKKGVKNPFNEEKIYLKEDLINVKLEEKKSLKTKLLEKFKRNKTPKNAGEKPQKAKNSAQIQGVKNEKIKTAQSVNLREQNEDLKTKNLANLNQKSSQQTSQKSLRQELLKQKKPLSDIEKRMQKSLINREKILETSALKSEPKQETKLPRSKIKFRDSYLSPEFSSNMQDLKNENSASNGTKRRFDETNSKLLLTKDNKTKAENKLKNKAEFQTKTQENDLKSKSKIQNKSPEIQQSSPNLLDLAIDFDLKKDSQNSLQVKSVLLEGHSHATKEEKNLGLNQLLFATLCLLFVLLVFVPKIYITSNIYYLSRDIASLRTQEGVLSEENKELSKRLENMRFKNQILDYLE